MNDANPPSPATVDRPALRRVAGSVLVGTTIEWYDFQIYGASAALVFCAAVLFGRRPRAGDNSFLRHLRGRLPGAATRRCCDGPLRRPHRTQEGLGARTSLDGSSDVPGRRPFRPPPRSVCGAPILLVLLRLIQGLRRRGVSGAVQF